MRSLAFSFLLFFAMPYAAATETTKLGLRSYLQKAAHPKGESNFTGNGSEPFLSSVELRAATKDDLLDSVKLHFTPFAWGERASLKQLTKVEIDLTSMAEKEAGAVLSQELWTAIIAYRQARREEPAIRRMISTSDRILDVLKANPLVLAEKPEYYLEIMEDKRGLQQQLTETINHCKALEATLGSFIGLSEVQLELSELKAPETIKNEVSTWTLTDETPESKKAALMSARADQLAELERLQNRQMFTFFEVGTSLKPDGSSRSLELEVGVELPLGRFETKAHELHREKILLKNEVLTQRYQSQREFSELKKIILDSAERLNGTEYAVFEETLDNAQKNLARTYGPSSIVLLKTQYAENKYRLKKLESEALLYQSYLDLSFLLGHLNADGTSLLAAVTNDPKKEK